MVYNADKVKWSVMEEDLGPWLRGEVDEASIFLLASRSWPGLNLASPVYSVRDYRGFLKRFRQEKRREKASREFWPSGEREIIDTIDIATGQVVKRVTPFDMQRHMLSQAQAAWAAGACSLNEEARALPQMTWKTMDALGKLKNGLTQAWQEAQTLHASVQRHVQSASSLEPPPKRTRRSHPRDWWPEAVPNPAPSE
jgi:hypothetical protein